MKENDATPGSEPPVPPIMNHLLASPGGINVLIANIELTTGALLWRM